MAVHLKKITREQWLDLKSVGAVCCGVHGAIEEYFDMELPTLQRWHEGEMQHLYVLWENYFTVVESEEIGDVEADN